MAEILVQSVVTVFAKYYERWTMFEKTTTTRWCSGVVVRR